LFYLENFGGFMNKKFAILLCGFITATSFAQDSFAAEYVYRESKRFFVGKIVFLDVVLFGEFWRFYE